MPESLAKGEDHLRNPHGSSLESWHTWGGWVSKAPQMSLYDCSWCNWTTWLKYSTVKIDNWKISISPWRNFLHHPNMDGTVTVRYSTFVHRGPHRRRAPFPLSAVREVVMGRLRSYGDFKTFFFLFRSFFSFFPFPL